MTINQPTRRQFIGTSSALAAGLMLAGCTAPSEPSTADGLPSHSRGTAVPTLCELCPERCAFSAIVSDGALTNVLADGTHPNARGSLCVCGYTLPDVIAAEARITEPHRRTATDAWETLSWDQAVQDIAAQLASLTQTHGAESIALVHDGRPSHALYGETLLHALGSPHVVNASQRGADVARALELTTGARAFYPDAANTKMLLLVGQASSGSAAPREASVLHEAKAQGASVCRVSAYRTASDTALDEWVPLAPGTELAFLLAIAQVIVEEDLYDHRFVASCAEGFDAWATTLSAYRPAWAETVTGIPAATIVRLARALANNAPAASVCAADLCDHYANSGEAARTMALINTLIGAWNQAGGALLPSDLSFAEADASCIPAVPSPAEEGVATIDALAKAVKAGDVRGLLVFGAGASEAFLASLEERPETLELCVVVDSHRSAATERADYLLSCCAVLEHDELPSFDPGPLPLVSVQKQVLEPACPTVRPVSEIVVELAHACGIGQFFEFSPDEVYAARLRSVGLAETELAHASFAPLFDKQATYGDLPNIVFSNEALEEAGMPLTAQWIEPLAHPTDDVRAFRMIRTVPPTCISPYASGEKTRSIAAAGGLERTMMNRAAARDLGIEEGDEIVIETSASIVTRTVHLTSCVHPKALLVPSDAHSSSVSDETIVSVTKGASR
ncbi:molybdopterin-containing oxidoreductase family protein [Eggerthella sinensis]|uniref:molybdopterin-containing oxidoreductase family protein n=1 Tax=Eggerthella sinensis TaxID=242230 RepID=UPI00266CD32B|nr:molybdopterin-dependent oxidoreductase [Eggerthella sinensis]